MKKTILVVGLVVSSMFLGCTEQQRARSYGGKAEIMLPQGKKLVVATWKQDDLWLLTRNRKQNEEVETYQFQESSSWGVLEGTVVIQEQ